MLPYKEYKKAVIETYEGLYKDFGHSLPDDFYSLLHDFDSNEKNCEIDSVIFYMAYADICLTNNENIDFMKKDLLKNYVLCNKDNDTVGVNYKI